MLQFFAKLFGGQRQKPPGRQRPQVRLSIEELDGRVLPNASALSAATSHCLGHADHAASSSDTPNSASTSTSGTTHGACSGHTSSAGATLTANLTNASGATGPASLHANRTVQQG